MHSIMHRVAQYPQLLAPIRRSASSAHKTNPNLQPDHSIPQIPNPTPLSAAHLQPCSYQYGSHHASTRRDAFWERLVPTSVRLIQGWGEDYEVCQEYIYTPEYVG